MFKVLLGTRPQCYRTKTHLSHVLFFRALGETVSCFTTLGRLWRGRSLYIQILNGSFHLHTAAVDPFAPVTFIDSSQQQ